MIDYYVAKLGSIWARACNQSLFLDMAHARSAYAFVLFPCLNPSILPGIMPGVYGAEGSKATWLTLIVLYDR